MTKEQIENKLYVSLIKSIKASRKEKYNPTTLIKMLSNDTAINVAKKLIKSEQTPSGFLKMQNPTLRKYSIEYIIYYDEDYHKEFKHELPICKKRLNL